MSLFPKKVFECIAYLDNGERVEIKYLSEYITASSQLNKLLTCVYNGVDIEPVFRFRNNKANAEDLPSAIWKAIENNSKNMWELELNNRQLIH